jgi:hypothetical protein
VQPEPTAVSERAREGEKGVLKTRPKELLDIALSETENLQPPCNVDIALSDIENSQPLWELEGTKEDPPEPTLTPDTYLLTSNAGKAIWTQLRTIAIGTIVVQALPSGYIEDLGGALVTTIESISPCRCQTGEIAPVRLGMACVAAHLHIKLQDEWMTALQATQRGHGTLLQEHTYSQLLGLCLHGGGNVLINTSTSVDETPTLTGVATRGYRPDLSSEPKSDRFITYPLHEGRAGELRAALAKPSYCDVARHHFKDVLDRPTPPISPPVPDPTSPKPKKDSERPQRLIKDESRKDDKGSSFTLPGGYSARQRQLEENADVESGAKVTPSASITTNPVPKPILTTAQNLTSETPDIYLRTPDGIPVSELEAQWEHNPYAQECGDTSGFL